MLILLLSFVISFLLVAFMLPHILLLSLRKRLVDPIDRRKVHNLPASRLGGVTFYPSILFSAWFCISIAHLTQSISGSVVSIDIALIMESLSLLTLFLIGVYDDILGVAYKYKFSVQIFAALLIVLSGSYFKTLHGLFGIESIPAYFGMPLSILFYVFVTNAINLIDGIDGLASLLSIMALFVYGVLLFHNGQLDNSIFAIATLGALVPFCALNVLGVKREVKSKIFMGDTGSLVIGAIVGLMAIKVWNISYVTDGMTPITPNYYILAYTMLIVPCFDVIRIVIFRYRNKQPLFLPDKNHIHHIFMGLGCCAQTALLCIMTINTLFVVLNLFLANKLNITSIIAIDIILWTLIHRYIKHLGIWKSREEESSKL
ncbi:MAG: MraY family glycosyltransferase [Rikenellaceae bacterium]